MQVSIKIKIQGQIGHKICAFTDYNHLTSPSIPTERDKLQGRFQKFLLWPATGGALLELPNSFQYPAHDLVREDMPT